MVRRAKSNNSGGANAPRLPNGNINWSQVYIEYLEPLIASQIAPNTSRGLLYSLLSKDVLKKSDYQGLKKHLVTWRQDKVIDWDDVADGSGRGVINDFGDYRTANGIIDGNIGWLKNAGTNYREKFLLNQYKWFGQPHYIEFQVEKHAMTGTLDALLKEEFTRIVFNRGNSGWEAMRQVAIRLKEQRYTINLKTGKLFDRMSGKIPDPITGELGSGIHVWYLGDRDRKGDHMDFEIRDQLGFFGLTRNKIDFRRIAVKDTQIKEFGLIPSGDKGEYQIDALNVTNPEKFKKLLLDHVTPYFDKKIHALLLKRNPENLINRTVKSKIKFLTEKQQQAKLKNKRKGRTTKVNRLAQWIEKREYEQRLIAAKIEAMGTLDDTT